MPIPLSLESVPTENDMAGPLVSTPPKLLLADPEPDKATWISPLLQEKYVLQFARNGQEAITKITEGYAPDLVLLNVTLPDTDGPTFLEKMHHFLETQGIPVILLADHADAVLEQRGLELGAADYVTLPVIPAILQRRIHNQLAVHTTHKQIQHYLDVERNKLQKLVAIAKDLSMERDIDSLLRKILHGGKDLTYADKATLYLRTENNQLRFAYLSSGDQLPSFLLPLYDPETGQEVHRFVATHVALTGESVLLEDIYNNAGTFDVSGTLSYDRATGYRSQSMLTVALKPREGAPLGVLQLINPVHPETKTIVPFDPEWIGFVEALATQGAIALDNLNLMQAQENLFNAIIRVMASAIDAKSPYTGGHCERVPMLGNMLAEAACNANSGPFAHFSMSKDDWKEFHLAGWMHDCGKVTTPEVVVDKATKLECVSNRIHEIRMRFEVLWRDAQIDHLEQRLAGHNPDAAQLQATLATLRDDFAFIARCNVGDDLMTSPHLARIQEIASRTWQRYFDDRLGLSNMEELRLADTPPSSVLPAREPLLMDRPEHKQPRQNTRLSYDPVALGITLKIPEYSYNFGEIYNLCIPRGTLNAEERFKINEHVIHTLVMLRQLPFPKGMTRVPELASSHHETMKGTGYPCGLNRDQMSIQARILAVADIFEALTAVDRPYKKAKTLSESLKIMRFMCKDQHIDRDVFALFLTSGIYRQYAETHLKAEQWDDVSVEELLLNL
ncbi:MAG: response regulator [Magnetococcales bacterium]|nr:response regulator [Magnetococcales bacterium]